MLLSATMAELTSYVKDFMMQEAEIIYYLALYRKHLLIDPWDQKFKPYYVFQLLL